MLSKYQIIKRIILSEKSTGMEDVNVVTFEVNKKAKKDDIKKAVEEIFNVRVMKVNTLNIRGKNVVFRGRKGRQRDMKKAYVFLHPEDSIDVFNQMTGK